MKRAPGRERRTLEAAERVARVLEAKGVASAVIGAMALAAHGYVRATRDFDLATHADPLVVLPALRRELEEAGLEADFRAPDSEDPLGGVIEVQAKGSRPIQIVNFLNPLARRGTLVGKEAIDRAQAGLIEGSSLRVTGLPQLIALKLYAGGPLSRNDVLELLERNRPLELRPIREACGRHGLAADLEKLIRRDGTLLRARESRLGGSEGTGRPPALATFPVPGRRFPGATCSSRNPRSLRGRAPAPAAGRNGH